jgi:hypothetical protein
MKRRKKRKTLENPRTARVLTLAQTLVITVSSQGHHQLQKYSIIVYFKVLAWYKTASRK